MAVNLVDTASPTLETLYTGCIQSLGRLVGALGETNCRVVHLDQVRISDILESYGRARIWGSQTKADLPARARGSLDDTLRHDDELRIHVQAILKRLKAVLDQAFFISKRKYNPIVSSDQDSVSSVSADSSCSSAPEIDDDEVERPRRTIPKICLLVQQLQGQIRSLYDLSSLLRRPRITDRYIRSIGSKPITNDPTDSDSVPLFEAFRVVDEKHIEEKIMQWCYHTMGRRSVTSDEGDDEATAETEANNRIASVQWLCRRLAQANTRRREQLQYWKEHPYIPKLDLAREGGDKTNLLVGFEEVRQESKSQTSTLKPPVMILPPKGPESGTIGRTSNTSQTRQTTESFSTAAVSDIHDTKSEARPQTTYTGTEVGQYRPNSVPDPPRTAKGSTTFSCPYCGMVLQSSEMQNRQLWKRHVFRDLRPYICTFQDCHNSGKLYVSRHEWIYHELQVHRRQYICQDCHQVCFNRKDILAHLRNHYSDASFSPAQLNVIADLCVRQIDMSDSRQAPCPICGEHLSLSFMQKHLATHMEDLSLFVLPRTDDDETEASIASAKVFKPASEKENDDTESEESSLSFFDVGDNHWQTPVEFSKFLAGEEAGYISKVSDWDLGAEDQTSASTGTSFGNPVDSRSVHSVDRIDTNTKIEGSSTLEDNKLLLAALNGDYHTVQVLLDGGCNVDLKDDNGRSPLLLAASRDHMDVVKLLIENGSDVNSVDKNGQSALSLAAKHDHGVIVKILIDAGSNVNRLNNFGRSPVSWAAENGSGSIVKMLLSANCDTNLVDNTGRSPLSWAAGKGHTSIVKMFRDATNHAASIGRDEDSTAAERTNLGVMKINLAYLLPHQGLVCARFSQDGKYLATGSRQTARIYDVATGETLYTFQDSGEESLEIKAVCFSHDGRYLVTAIGAVLNVWDIMLQKVHHTFRGHRDVILCLDVSCRSGLIASGGADKAIRLWNIYDRQFGEYMYRLSAVECVAISPYGKYIASAGNESVGIWDFHKHPPSLVAWGMIDSSVKICALNWSMDGTRLLSAGSDPINMWDTSTLGRDLRPGPNALRKMMTIGESVGHRTSSVYLTADSQWVISCSSGAAQFWSSDTGESQLIQQNPNRPDTAMFSTVSPVGGAFATGGDGWVCIWSYRYEEADQG